MFCKGDEVALFDPGETVTDEDFAFFYVVGEDGAAGFDGFFAVDAFLEDADGTGCDDFADVAEVCFWAEAWFLIFFYIGVGFFGFFFIEEDFEFVGTGEGEAGVFDGDVFEVNEDAFLSVEIHAAVAVDDGGVGVGFDFEGFRGRDFGWVVLDGFYFTGFDEGVGEVEGCLGGFFVFVELGLGGLVGDGDFGGDGFGFGVDGCDFFVG